MFDKQGGTRWRYLRWAMPLIDDWHVGKITEELYGGRRFLVLVLCYNYYGHHQKPSASLRNKR